MLTKVNSISRTWSLNTAISFFLVMSSIAIPISTTGKSVFLALSLVGILLSSQHRYTLYHLLSYNWCRAGLFLFLVVLVSIFWSPANAKDKLWVLEKYTKLLYLPILAIGFQDPNTRRMSINAFLGAMIITCFFSIIKYFELFGFEDIGVGFVFRNHIMTSSMMAFAAYICGLKFFHAKRRVRVVYGAIFLLLTYQLLFINGGRMGYIAFLLLMTLLMTQVLSRRQALAGLIMICALFALTYAISPMFKNRVNSVIVDIQNYQHHSKDTAIGYRLQFHQYAFNLFKQSPWIGHGTASFPYHFNQEKPVPSWQHLLEPHSQYWLMAAEFGLLGEFALLVFFACLARASLHLKTMRMMAFAVLIPFIVGNLSDSLLFYSGSGYFFIFFMALCLGEQVCEKNGLAQNEEY